MVVDPFLSFFPTILTAYFTPLPLFLAEYTYAEKIPYFGVRTFADQFNQTIFFIEIKLDDIFLQSVLNSRIKPIILKIKLRTSVTIGEMQQKLLSNLQIIHIQILGLAIALVFLIIFLLLLSHIHLLKNTGALHYNTRYNELSTCRMSSQFWSMNRYVFW